MYHKGSEKRRSRSRSPRGNKRAWRRGGSPSSSSSKDKDNHNKRRQFDKPKQRRVKSFLFRFVKDDHLLNIKIFRKEDEPNAKPLNDTDLYDYQLRLKSENRSTTYFNPEELKHKESLMEGESMKKYKEKEKTFNDKLMLAKEDILYYPPPFLKTSPLVEGEDSIEKDAHNTRINTTLGCFYSRVGEIPDEPAINAILNDIPSETAVKSIAFERTSREQVQQISKFAKPQQKERPRPPKGILKRSIEELSRLRQREMEEKYRRDHQSAKIDSTFLRIINDISTNKNHYSMEQMEEMLKPYKQNGMLEQYVKGVAASKQAAKTSASVPVMPGMRTSLDFNIMNKPVMVPMMPVRTDKFKTVPCKYFHSPMGCQKKDQCTFIHDQSCAGFPTRNMHKYVKGMEAPPGGYYFMPKPGMAIPRPNLYPLADGMPGGAPYVNINLNSLNNNGGMPSTNMNRTSNITNGNGQGIPGPNLNPNNMNSYSTGAYNPIYQSNYMPHMGINNLGAVGGQLLPPNPFLSSSMPNLPPPPPPTHDSNNQQYNRLN